MLECNEGGGIWGGRRQAAGGRLLRVERVAGKVGEGRAAGRGGPQVSQARWLRSSEGVRAGHHREKAAVRRLVARGKEGVRGETKVLPMCWSTPRKGRCLYPARSCWSRCERNRDAQRKVGRSGFDGGS